MPLKNLYGPTTVQHIWTNQAPPTLPLKHESQVTRIYTTAQIIHSFI